MFKKTLILFAFTTQVFATVQVSFNKALLSGLFCNSPSVILNAVKVL